MLFFRIFGLEHCNPALNPYNKDDYGKNIFYINSHPLGEGKTFTCICLVHKVTPAPAELVISTEKYIAK